MTRVPDKDGIEELMFDNTQPKTVKPGIIVERIIMLIRTVLGDNEPELPRRAKQAYMATKIIKRTGALTPPEEGISL